MRPLLPEDLHHVLSHTAGLWAELRGGRLFITGGTGFFGKWLLESFLAANAAHDLNARVTVLTRSASAFVSQAPHLAAHPAVQLYEGDVRTFNFPDGPYTHVIHAATTSATNVNEADPEAMLDIIIRGTRRTLDFARHAGVRQFLLTSSGAVYGRQPPDLSHVPEDYPGAPDPLDPRSAYGEGKRVAEHLCAVAHAHHGLGATVARCFAFVGPHLPLDTHFAVGNFLRDGLGGGPIRVTGDGTPYRSYLYAADLAVWLWAVLLRGRPGRAYNVGSDADLTIATLARAVAAYFHTDVEIARPPSPDRPAERYVPDTRRAARELGLRAWTDLGTALDRTARWHRGLPRRAPGTSPGGES